MIGTTDLFPARVKEAWERRIENPRLPPLWFGLESRYLHVSRPMYVVYSSSTIYPQSSNIRAFDSASLSV